MTSSESGVISSAVSGMDVQAGPGLGQCPRRGSPGRLGTPQITGNYTGYERTENFASPGGTVPGEAHIYAAPAKLMLNQWALSGNWTMEEQATTLNEAGGQIACRFRARDLNLVMRRAGSASRLGRRRR